MSAPQSLAKLRARLVVAGAGEPGPRVDDVGPVGASRPSIRRARSWTISRLDDPVGDGAGVVAAVTRVQDDGPAAQAVPGAADVLALAQRQRRPAGDADGAAR